MMEKLIDYIGFVLLVSPLCASLSYFVYFEIEDGQIFGFWNNILEKHLKKTILYKPLGGCIVCMNIWVTWLLVSIVNHSINVIPFDYFYFIIVLPFCGAVSNTVISIILNITGHK